MLPLALRDWTLHVDGAEGRRNVLDGISLQVPAGRTVALVGESGSGKSTVALGALGLLDEPPFVHAGGEVLLGGHDLLPLAEAQRAPLRPGRVAMVFQDPGAAFNPTRRLGAQLDEAARLAGARGSLAVERGRLLREVGFADPEALARAYPHALSGGMRQRAAVAMALLGRPALLVADEPTTALDVTVQAQLLALLRAQVRRRDMACLLVTHDLGVAAGLADRVAVLYAGRVVEEANVGSFFTQPRHPYAAALLAAARDLLAPPPPGAPPPAAVLGADGRRPSGCDFAGRCPRARERCWTSTPPLTALETSPALGLGTATPAASSVDGRAAAEVDLNVADGDRVRCFHPLGNGEIWADLVAAAQPSAGVKAPTAAREVDEPEASFGAPALRLVDVAVRYGPLAAPRWWPLRRRVSPPTVAGVTLALWPGEILALVGESGSGKSTLMRAVLQLLPLAAGEVWLGDDALHALWPRGTFGAARRPTRALRRLRARLQAAFQDPRASLDPRQSALASVIEPLLLHRPALDGAARRREALQLLAEVGLPATLAARRPHALSGGQRQRVALARALAPEPQVLLADEPTSALDVCVKGQVLALLRRLTADRRLATLLVTHDLAAVRAVAARTAVLAGGRVVELAPTSALMATPRHPYTRALLAAEPVADPTRQPGRLDALAAARPRPWASRPWAGCDPPPLVEVTPGHFVAVDPASVDGAKPRANAAV